MTSTSAIIIAAALQVIFRVSIFVTQREDICLKTPNFASWLFLTGYLDILWDTRIYPVRYMHVPQCLQIIIETIAAILLTEMGTLIVWCNIERLCCITCKYLLLFLGVPLKFYYNWELYILGIVTTVVSLIFLMFALKATDRIYFLRKRGKRLSSKLIQAFRKVWNSSKKYMLRLSFRSQPQYIVIMKDKCNDNDSDNDVIICPNRNSSRRRSSNRRYCKPRNI